MRSIYAACNPGPGTIKCGDRNVRVKNGIFAISTRKRDHARIDEINSIMISIVRNRA